MNINIKRINITHVISDTDYVQKRIASLDKFIVDQKENVHADVELSKTTSHHKTGDVFRVSVNLRGGGIQLYTEEEDSTLFAAIDKVRDELAGMLKKDHKKKATLVRRGATRVKNILKGFGWGR